MAKTTDTVLCITPHQVLRDELALLLANELLGLEMLHHRLKL
jgi:aromatic ring-opening dioxygenase LigB subunit